MGIRLNLRMSALAFRLFWSTQDHGVADRTALIGKAKAQYAFQTVKRLI
jgi:hypothetical protein